MIIHSVIFIAQFEPTFNTPDLYERVNDRDPLPVKTENHVARFELSSAK